MILSRPLSKAICFHHARVWLHHPNTNPPARWEKNCRLGNCKWALTVSAWVTDVRSKTHHIVLFNCKEMKPYSLCVPRREGEADDGNTIHIYQSRVSSPVFISTTYWVLVIILYSVRVKASLQGIFQCLISFFLFYLFRLSHFPLSHN